MADGSFCTAIYTAYPLKIRSVVIGNVGLGGLIIGAGCVISAALTIFWIQQQRRRAYEGQSGAVKHVIFPVYIPFMWGSAFSDLLFGSIIFFVDGTVNHGNTCSVAITYAAAYAIQHFILEGIAFLLMQYGCGYQATRRAIFCAFIWAIGSLILWTVVYHQGLENNNSMNLVIGWDTALFLFYSTLWLAPETWLFRRTAVVRYSMFWTLKQALVLLSEFLVLHNSDEDARIVSTCVYNIGVIPMLLICKPFLIYHVLLLDSRWWQGVLTPQNGSVDEMHSSLHPHSSGSLFGSSLLIRKISGALGLSSSKDGLPSHSYHSVPSDPHSRRAGFGGLIWSFITLSWLLPKKHSTGRRESEDEISESLESGEQSLMASGSLRSSFYDEYDVDSQSLSSSLQSIRQLEGNRYEQITGPLLGVEVGFNQAVSLAQEVDKMRTEGAIKLLNFAYLSLDKGNGGSLLGVGSFSKVYSGRYRGEAVAVKMLFTQDLNPDVIRRCTMEARILSEVAHPNVVQLYGVTVLPPCVCLVLEVCAYGSLSDVLRGPISPLPGTKPRPPLLLSYADRMFLALGCAMGVQALHSHSPDLCHRDIKSFNFLIDSQLNAKIADLDLGRWQPQERRLTNAGQKRTFFPFRGSRRPPSDEQQQPFGGSDMNVSWQAPEVVLKKEYTQSSDIYSLALVLWEIISTGPPPSTKLNKFHHNFNKQHGKSRKANNSGKKTPVSVYGGVPFFECKNQYEVREKILGGGRPPVPLVVGSSEFLSSIQGESRNSTERDGMLENGALKVPDPLFLDLMTLGWDTEPMKRPNINTVVEILKQCWTNSLHSIIRETDKIVDIEKVQEENFKLRLLCETKGSMNGFSPQRTLFQHRGTQPGSAGFLATSAAQKKRAFRNPPNAELIKELRKIQGEPQLRMLEDQGALLLLSPLSPYYMLWATRNWTQLTGYLVNDVVAYDINLLFGPQTDDQKIQHLLSLLHFGEPQHLMMNIYRRDGQLLEVSAHLFPIFDSTSTEKYHFDDNDDSKTLAEDTCSSQKVSATLEKPLTNEDLSSTTEVVKTEFEQISPNTQESTEVGETENVSQNPEEESVKPGSLVLDTFDRLNMPSMKKVAYIMIQFSKLKK